MQAGGSASEVVTRGLDVCSLRRNRLSKNSLASNAEGPSVQPSSCDPPDHSKGTRRQHLLLLGAQCPFSQASGKSTDFSAQTHFFPSLYIIAEEKAEPSIALMDLRPLALNSKIHIFTQDNEELSREKKNTTLRCHLPIVSSFTFEIQDDALSIPLLGI